MSYFGRTATVTIGRPEDTGLLIQDLRITFSCKKTRGSDPNSCIVSIYNMNEDRRNKINNIDDILILKAGYLEADGLEDLFIGDIEEVTITKDKPDVITKVEVKDGRNYILKDVSNLSFGTGSTVRQILKEITKNASIDDNLDKITFTDLKFNYGFHFLGGTQDALDQLTDMVGISWSVQNNKIVFDKDAFTDFIAVKSYDQNSGLIGTPERIKFRKTKGDVTTNKKGWRIQTLLSPSVLPGDSVVVTSKDIGDKKRFKVISVNHEGDTWAGKFISTMEIISV